MNQNEHKALMNYRGWIADEITTLRKQRDQRILESDFKVSLNMSKEIVELELELFKVDEALNG
jgi:hypothetical protein